MTVFGVYWNQPVCPSVCLAVRLSVCLSVHPSVCVQSIGFFQSIGGGIKSHLVTTLVLTGFISLSPMHVVSVM